VGAKSTPVTSKVKARYDRQVNGEAKAPIGERLSQLIVNQQDHDPRRLIREALDSDLRGGGRGGLDVTVD
jgi:hypothetical protein